MSLRTRIALTFLGLQAILIGVSIQLASSVAIRAEREGVAARGRVLEELLGSIAEDALLAEKPERVQARLDPLCIDRTLLLARVTDVRGQGVASCRADLETSDEAELDGLWRRTTELRADSGPLGTLTLHSSDDGFRRSLEDIRNRSLIAAGLGALFAVVTAFSLGSLLTRRLRSASEIVQLVAEGDLSVRLANHHTDETGVLSHGFNEMLDRLDGERSSLDDARQRVASLLDTAPDAILRINEGGEIQDVNQATLQLFGYSAKELLGQNVRLLMPPPFSAEHDAYLKRYRETGQARIIGSGRDVQALRKDGTVFPIRLSVGETRTETTHLFTGVISDLTDRKAAETRGARLGVILEDSLNEIFVFDDQSLRFKLVNRGARVNLGYPMEELEQMTPLDIKPEYSREAFEDEIAPLRRGEISKLHFQTIHRRKDGSDYRVDVHLQHRAEAGEFVAIILDITEREELERQLIQSQKMEAIGTLAGGVAHDFNNLLTSILGSSELLLDKLDAESGLRKAATRIHLAAERGGGLTAQLLAFSRNQVTQPTAIELNRAVRETQDLFTRMIGEDVEVKLDLDPEVGVIRFDPSQLDQVIINLVVNARDAMPNGGVLKLKTGTTELGEAEARTLRLTEGRYSTLFIEDSGTGIDKELLDQIFDPFFTTKETGTGLGLSTVLGIVKRNEGAIAVESVEGQGTVFSLYLPRAEVPETAPTSAAVGSELEAVAEQTLLLVEDDALMRDLMVEVLEMAGHTVLVAENPEVALRIAHAHEGRIDLVVTDVVMPQMSGFELVHRLTEHSDSVRVLFMSGYTDQILANRGQLAPDDAFLRKPFSNDQLLEKVREVLAEAS